MTAQERTQTIRSLTYERVRPSASSIDDSTIYETAVTIDPEQAVKNWALLSDETVSQEIGYYPDFFSEAFIDTLKVYAK